MKKKYLLRLTSEERQRLMELVRKGKAAAACGSASQMQCSLTPESTARLAA